MAPGDAGAIADVINETGSGRVVLVCEHASNHVPAEFDDLGLPSDALESHIAWDPGARAVAMRLSELLDAPLVAARVSRLVYDCNRPPENPGAMPAQSEVYRIPGNRDLTPAQKRDRVERFYHPFRRQVDAVLDARAARGADSVLVTIHSFTPVFNGEPRTVEIGVIHDADDRLADAILAAGPETARHRLARNEPYDAADGVTHSLAIYGVARALPNAMIEIRNDLLTSAEARMQIADELAAVIGAGLTHLDGRMEGAADG